MLSKLTDLELERRLDLIERVLAKCPDKERPAWNAAFQALLDEQVRRDLEKEDAK